jgi:SAM-dependent methyltransferase
MPVLLHFDGELLYVRSAMGIPSQLAKIILREHGYRPITGSILSIGKQTVYLNGAQSFKLVRDELGERPLLPPGALELDQRTRGSRGEGFITDQAFYSLFSQAAYECLDVTPYEGATIIADLCGGVPEILHGRFDFIVNGSCLDNIFDPAMALRNMTRLLKSGGRIIHFERASRTHHVYVAFALSWFHDYYAINNFDDCQVYLAQWSKLLDGSWDIYRYAPILESGGRLEYFGQDRYYHPYRDGHAVVIAEKAESSTWERSPIQFGYRKVRESENPGGEKDVAPQSVSEHADNPYVRAALRFHNTRRPPIVSAAEKRVLEDRFFHYDPRIAYCGSLQPFGATAPS